MYGKELILDLHDCQTPFTRETIRVFMEQACELMGMQRADLHFWDYDNPEDKSEAPPHLCGTSAIQFITTSNITIHTLDKLRAVYLNAFTCSDLDTYTLSKFCSNYWQGTIVNDSLVHRL